MDSIDECVICSISTSSQEDNLNQKRKFTLENEDSEVFLLRNILELSRSTCTRILQSKQTEPPPCGIHFCSECHQTVTKAEVIYCELNNLKAQWKYLKAIVQKKIAETSNQKKKPGPKSKKQSGGIADTIRNETSAKAAKKRRLEELNTKDDDNDRNNSVGNLAKADHNEKWTFDLDPENIKVEYNSDELGDYEDTLDLNDHEEENSDTNIKNEDEPQTKRRRIFKYPDYSEENSDISGDENQIDNQEEEDISYNDPEFDPAEANYSSNEDWKPGAVAEGRRKSLYRKSKIKQKKGKFACKLCPKLSSSPLQLKNHEWRAHGVNHKFQCEFCKKCLANGYTLMCHIYSVHKAKKKKKGAAARKNAEMENSHSDEIDRSESQGNDRSQNEEMETEKTLFQCDFCEKRFTSIAKKKQHEQYAHSVKHEFKCDKCDKVLSNGYTLLRHIESVHNPRKVRKTRIPKREPDIEDDAENENPDREVEECDHSASKSDNLPEIVKIPDSEVGRYVCEFCPNVSKTMLKKKLHESRAHDVKHTFQCNKCNKCLANGYTLIRHIQSVHRPKKKKIRRIRRTIKTVTKVKAESSSGPGDEDDNQESFLESNVVLQDSELGEFMCEYCPNVSKTLLKKKLHESRTHGVQHTFKCQECNRVLANGYTLLRHIQSVHIRKKIRAKKYKKKDYRMLDDEAIGQARQNLTEADGNISLLSGSLDLSSFEDCIIGVYSCDHCQIISSTRLKKMEHERRAHGVKHPFKCQACEKCLANGYTLLRHIIACHVQKKPRAKKYHKSEDGLSVNAYAARKVLLKYNTLRNTSGIWKCQHCGKLCATQEKKNDHENRAHGEGHKFLCHCCPKYFLTSYSLERHMFDIHPAAAADPTSNGMTNPYANTSHIIIFKCELCGQICKSAAKLAQHTRKIHETERKPGSKSGKSFLCQQCGRSFPSLWDLRNHEFRVHNIDVPFPCKLCKRSYTTEAKLMSHFMVFHDGSAVPVECPECAKKFANKTVLRRHISRIHRQEKNFICEKCSAPFADHTELRQHQFTHHPTEETESGRIHDHPNF